jgi:hypothetical protein
MLRKRTGSVDAIDELIRYLTVDSLGSILDGIRGGLLVSGRDGELTSLGLALFCCDDDDMEDAVGSKQEENGRCCSHKWLIYLLWGRPNHDDVDGLLRDVIATQAP